MDVSMLVSIKTTKSMEREHSNGQMVVNILESGIKANNTEKEPILKKVKGDKVFGKWAKGSNGSKIIQATIMRELKSKFKYFK